MFCSCGKYERQKEADLSNLSDVRPASTMSQQYLYNRSYESPPPYSAHEKQPYYPSKQYPEMNDNTTRPVSTTAIRYGQVWREKKSQNKVHVYTLNIVTRNVTLMRSQHAHFCNLMRSQNQTLTIPYNFLHAFFMLVDLN